MEDNNYSENIIMNQTIQEAAEMREAMKLKFTYRYGSRMRWEQESVAAHSWSMMLVADYLLEKLNELAPWKYTLNREKIYSLIAYHDLIEAETGDEDVDPGNQENHSKKGDREKAVFQDFKAKLPQEIRNRFQKMFQEYEARETWESKFVKIVDCIEAEFFCHEKWYLFTSWTKEFHENLRYKHFEAFPELQPIIMNLIESCDQKYYSKQKTLC